MRGSLSVNHPTVRRQLNRLFLLGTKGSDRPRIMSPAEVFPASQELEANFDAVRAEVERLVEARTLVRYGDIDPMRAAEVSTGWRLYYAYMLGVANEQARRDLPTTLSFAERTPNVVNALVALLEPGVTLSAHEGPYAGILRYHLALRVPEHHPPRLRVHDERYTWRTGESIVIDDTFDHEVYNDSDSIRILLIIDIRRPLNPILDLVNRVSLRLKRRWSHVFIAQANGDI